MSYVAPALGNVLSILFLAATKKLFERDNVFNSIHETLMKGSLEYFKSGQLQSDLYNGVRGYFEQRRNAEVERLRENLLSKWRRNAFVFLTSIFVLVALVLYYIIYVPDSIEKHNTLLGWGIYVLDFAIAVKTLWEVLGILLLVIWAILYVVVLFVVLVYIEPIMEITDKLSKEVSYTKKLIGETLQ